MTAIVIRTASSDDQPAIDDLSRSAFEELRRIYRPSQAALSGKAALDVALSRLVAVFEHLGFRSIREQTDEWFIGSDGQPMTEVYMERDSRHVGYL